MLGFSLQLVCENETYGQECNYTCGQCRDNKNCYHTNGTCLSGCDPGYFGDLCKTGKEISCISTGYLQSGKKHA